MSWHIVWKGSPPFKGQRIRRFMEQQLTPPVSRDKREGHHLLLSCSSPFPSRRLSHRADVWQQEAMQRSAVRASRTTSERCVTGSGETSVTRDSSRLLPWDTSGRKGVENGVTALFPGQHNSISKRFAEMVRSFHESRFNTVRKFLFAFRAL